MLHTRLCDVLGITYPIISAPMGGASGWELAAAVSAAGGLGMIGGSFQSAEWLREQIDGVRKQTDRPFGVGFVTSSPDTDEMMEIALEHQVPVISHAFADAAPYIKETKPLGIKTMVQVQTLDQAIAAAEAGADIVAAQGMEAGGHTGMSNATLPFVPVVVDAVGANIPVVAAGGIADGRGLAAVLMLGADGAWMGTRFVASVESISADLNKQTIVKHNIDDFVFTRVYDIIKESPFPQDVGERVLRNRFTDQWTHRDDEVMERKEELLAEFEGSIASGDTSIARILAGNSAGLVHSIEPAADIVRQVVADAANLLRSRPGAVLTTP